MLGKNLGKLTECHTNTVFSCIVWKKGRIPDIEEILVVLTINFIFAIVEIDNRVR